MKRSINGRNARQITEADWLSVETPLNIQWSPEPITAGAPIRHEMIYRHIYADKASGETLWRRLRCQKKHRKRYGSGREFRGQSIGRKTISKRPTHIEERCQIRCWEGGTVIGVRHQHAVVSFVERKTGYTILAKVHHKTSDLVSRAIIRCLKPVQALVKTIISNNGKEFAEHARIDKAVGSTGYFADPFASC